MPKSKEIKLDPQEQFIKDTILSLKKTIRKNKDSDELTTELRACLKKAFSKVAAKNYAACWRKLNLRLHPDKIASQSPQLHQLLLDKAGEEGVATLQNLLTECKEAPTQWAAALAFIKSISNNELKINIHKSPRPIKWLMKALHLGITWPLEQIANTLVFAVAVVLAPLWLIRMSANSVLNGITGGAYKRAVLGTAKALNLKEVLFNDRKSELLSRYELELNGLVQDPMAEGEVFKLGEDLKQIIAELNEQVFDPKNPDALYLLELYFGNLFNYRNYRLQIQPDRDYFAYIQPDADYIASLKEVCDKPVYDQTIVYGPHRLYLIAKALFSSIVSPLPEGLGNKFMHLIFIRPIRLILAPILLGLHVAIEISLSVPVTLFGLVIITSLVAWLVETVLNIPYVIGKGISSLVSSCCKKGARKDEQDDLSDEEEADLDSRVSISNVADAMGRTPKANAPTTCQERDDVAPPHYQDPANRFPASSSRDQVAANDSVVPVATAGLGTNADGVD